MKLPVDGPMGLYMQVMVPDLVLCMLGFTRTIAIVMINMIKPIPAGSCRFMRMVCKLLQLHCNMFDSQWAVCPAKCNTAKPQCLQSMMPDSLIG